MTTTSGIISLSTAASHPTALTTASSPLDSGVTSSESLNGSTSSPTSTTSPSNVVTVSNLFPTPTNTPPPADPTRRGISQTVLMWIFAVIAVGLLSSIMIWRYTCSKFKRRRRAIAGSSGAGGDSGRIWTGFPGLGSASGSGLESPSILRTSDVPLGNQHGHGQTRPIILSTSFLHSGLVPVVRRDGTLVREARPHLHPHHHHRHHHHRHHHHQRVRGADVDEGGRRGGGGGSDAGGSIALDELPAYHEAGKSPPGYQAVAFLPNYLPVAEGGGVSVSQSQNQAAQAQSQNESPSPSQGQIQSPSQSPSQSQPPPVPYASRPNFENENEDPIPDRRPSSSSSNDRNENVH